MQNKRAFIGYYNIANLLTLMGLMCALASCYSALNGKLVYSVIFLIVSGICDLFDGAVARKIKRTDFEKEFGIQLDTVADVVGFGIAPIIIAFSLVSAEWYALVVYAFYIVAAVIRLAYFNTTALPNVRTEHYFGLPVTSIALILPLVLLSRSVAAIVATLAVVSVLFVLNIKIPKPRGIWYLILPAFAAALIVLWWLV